MLLRNTATAASLAGKLTATTTIQFSKLMLALSWTSGKPANVQAVLDILKAIKVSIAVWQDGDNKKIYRSVPLDAICEFDAHTEGLTIFEQDSATTIGKVLAGIPVSPFGAIDLTGDDYFNIEFSGLPTTAGLNFALHTIQTPVTDASVYDMVQITAQSDDPSRQFSVANFNHLLVPIADVDTVVINYGNGKSQQIEKDELKYFQGAANDSFMLGQTTAHPIMGAASYGRFACLDITTASQVTVDKPTGAAAILYGVRHIPIGNPVSATRLNSALVDTTISA